MESHKTRPWYAGVKEVPRELVGLDAGGNGGLQVVDIARLDPVLGRIPRLSSQSGKRLVSARDVVFDPSMGRLRA